VVVNPGIMREGRELCGGGSVVRDRRRPMGLYQHNDGRRMRSEDGVDESLEGATDEMSA
jgi:hypothetical protein